MDIAISFVLTLIVALTVYMCFEKSGFIAGLLATVAINLIKLYVQNGMNIPVTTLVFILIGSFLSAAINYWLYQKMNTFYTYFIVSLVAGFVLSRAMDIVTKMIITGMIYTAAGAMLM